MFAREASPAAVRTGLLQTATCNLVSPVFIVKKAAKQAPKAATK